MDSNIRIGDAVWYQEGAMFATGYTCGWCRVVDIKYDNNGRPLYKTDKYGLSLCYDGYEFTGFPKELICHGCDDCGPYTEYFYNATDKEIDILTSYHELIMNNPGLVCFDSRSIFQCFSVKQLERYDVAIEKRPFLKSGYEDYTKEKE